jgi:hypothetical protein
MNQWGERVIVGTDAETDINHRRNSIDRSAANRRSFLATQRDLAARWLRLTLEPRHTSPAVNEARAPMLDLPCCLEQ